MKLLAYAVHLFTALGAALGLWAVILIFNGFYQEALWVLAGSVAVDSVDGALARLVNVKKHAPGIDGALMDNIIDYITWTVAPLLWVYATMHIPLWVLLICAVSSIFYFSNTEAKTADNYFTGFPSYWNIVVLYLFLLDLPVGMASAILLFFCVVSFLPVRFVYPTRTRRLKPLTLFLGALYALQLAALLYYYEESSPYLVYSSFAYPVYYFTLSFYLNLKNG